MGSSGWLSALRTEHPPRIARSSAFRALCYTNVVTRYLDQHPTTRCRRFVQNEPNNVQIHRDTVKCTLLRETTRFPHRFPILGAGWRHSISLAELVSTRNLDRPFVRFDHEFDRTMDSVVSRNQCNTARDISVTSFAYVSQFARDRVKW